MTTFNLSKLFLSFFFFLGLSTFFSVEKESNLVIDVQLDDPFTDLQKLPLSTVDKDCNNSLFILDNILPKTTTFNGDMNVIGQDCDSCYADLRYNEFVYPFKTGEDGSIVDLVMPDHENFSIDYVINGGSTSDTIFLSGSRANNFMDSVLNNYTQEYLDLVNNDSSDIPAVFLRSQPSSETEISFDFSAEHPENFDFTIWDIDRRDSCKIEVYDNMNQLLSLDILPPSQLTVHQGGLFNNTAPLSIWDPSIGSIHAPPGDTNSFRNYFVLRFTDIPISRITTTYYGISNIEIGNCDLDTSSASCPNLYFSIYVRDIAPPIANAGDSIVNGCAGNSVILDGSGSDSGANIQYLWEGPGILEPENIINEVDESGQYILTVTRDDGVCSYMAMDTVDVFFHVADSTYLDTLTSCFPSDTGLVVSLLQNQFTCDSFVFQYTALALADSTFLPVATSCFPSDTGLVVSLLENQFTCDSFVFQYTSLLPSSENFITLTSCNPIDTGLVITVEINYLGCDSTIYTQTNLLTESENFITLTSCNPLDTGLVITVDTNYLGCDSITHQYTTLFSSETLNLFESTCDPNLVGIYSDTLTSYLGCDSLIQLTDIILEETPELQNDTFLIQEDDLPLMGDLTMNDVLSNNTDWFFTIDNIENQGQFNDLGNGVFSYDGPAGFVRFSYEVCNEDCPNLCDTALVLIESDLCSLPDILTPNGDKFNETLWINCLENPLLYPNPKLTIINRWQDIVYESQGYANGSWHGQNKKGGMLPSGTYYIILELGNGAGDLLKGPITVIR